jgi:hypothetical protein
MLPEEARQRIGRLLNRRARIVQHHQKMNISAGLIRALAVESTLAVWGFLPSPTSTRAKDALSFWSVVPSHGALIRLHQLRQRLFVSQPVLRPNFDQRLGSKPAVPDQFFRVGKRHHLVGS